MPFAPRNIDAAALRVVNARGTPVTVYGAPTECFNCSLPRLGRAGPLGATPLAVGLSPSLALAIEVRTEDGRTRILSTTLPFPDELARYTLVLHGGSDSATLLLDAPGRNGLFPLLYAALALAALAAAHWLACAALAAVARRAGRSGALHAALSAAAAPAVGGKRDPRAALTVAGFFGFDRVLALALAEASQAAPAHAPTAADQLGEGLLLAVEPAAEASAPAPAPPKAAASAASALSRVRALDAFRGLTLCVMAFANAGCGGYAFLGHASWNGLQMSDLCFPLFVFFSGVSHALSSASERRRGTSARALALKALVRACKLYVLGVFLVNGVRYFPTMRMFSVLGYFAASTLVVGLIDAFLPALEREPTWGPCVERSPRARAFAAALWRDVLRYGLQHAAAAAVLICYVALEYLPHKPGCIRGYRGPGGRADQGAFPPECVGGGHRIVDEALVGLQHMYGSPTCRSYYACGAFDPEGTVAALGASLLAYLGLQCGRALVAEREEGGDADRFALARRLATRWCSSAAVFGFIAGCLCGFAREGGLVPLNKNLWSPSLVFAIAALGNAGMAAAIYLVDALRLSSGAPLRYAGANSLLFYVVSELPFSSFPWRFQLSAAGWSSHEEVLASNVTQIVFLLALMRVCHLKAITLVV
jgi:predicted acyltransferase